ncbi:hypothetical protein [Gellertiella hungarica]|uniref:Lipoprotein n=1 Tax=Gellertiella hungarica TaxID=1572859 RepID=A0A7W6J3X6_9HYPH|nr:hypothetical protein [Gellertiella hungarica]MBB4063408.1 hypothetical protein [Gellertiella hungarica]
MQHARTAIGVLCVALVLSGCNTTDALTPQVDVGGGRFPNSSPVTDQDLDQMARTQQPVYPSQPQAAPVASPAPVASNTLRPPPSPAYPQEQAPAGTGAPPTTLDEQAASLGRGADEQPATPNGSNRGGTPQLAAPAETAPAPEQPASAEASSAQTLRFLPIIGAPLPAVTPLSRQLGAEARARGITIRSSADKSARHVLKGYFSAVSGGGSITITYVWDVLDGNGARLNRIQGQESFPGNAADPWAAVPPSVMQTIATKTMDSYTQWAAGP